MVRMFIAQGLSGSRPRLADTARNDIAERRRIGEKKLQAALEAAKDQPDGPVLPVSVIVRRKQGGTTQ